MTPRRWMVVGGLLLALASPVAGANEPEVFLKFDWHAQGEPAVSSLKIKDYPMAEDMVLPAPFFVGSLACVEAAVPLAGKLNRTRSCFRLGIENGLPVALGGSIVEGGCDFVDGGAVRVTEIALGAKPDPQWPRHFVMGITKVSTKRDAYGCMTSSPVTAVYTRGAVASVRLTSVPEDGATVRLLYSGDAQAMAIGNTSGNFQVPFASPSESVLLFVAKAGFEPCVFEWTAASGPLQTMTCVLKRPAAH